MLLTPSTVVYDGSGTLGHIVSEINIEGHQLGKLDGNPSSGKIYSTKGVLSIEFDKLSNIKRIAIYLNFKSTYKQLEILKI